MRKFGFGGLLDAPRRRAPIRPEGTDEQYWHGVRQPKEMTEQFGRGRVRPVQIVKHKNRRELIRLLLPDTEISLEKLALECFAFQFLPIRIVIHGQECFKCLACARRLIQLGDATG